MTEIGQFCFLIDRDFGEYWQPKRKYGIETFKTRLTSSIALGISFMLEFLSCRMRLFFAFSRCELTLDEEGPGRRVDTIRLDAELVVPRFDSALPI